MNHEKTVDLRVKRTKKHLHNALFEIMEKQPFESITVKQICDLAMVHRTTFYTHFQDKYDLLSQAMRQIAEEEIDFSTFSHSPSQNFKELFAIAAKHKNLFSQLLMEERDSLRNLLRREMGAGIQMDMVNNFSFTENSIEMRIKVEAYVGAVLGVLTWWIENNMPINQEEMCRKMDIFSDFKFAE
ncbi:TetR/AcrR family transcriptional regulator C-terminal domain-containing protein [Paenibacillus sp. SYP-B4298]|uniref:TetR/AcrR family transcriptional regulator C-terminal domain-containing protein n=1 Tax=Paenibacillus sp. SYP-B4298 TaxID=2996034 RepID=UPI0022DD860A|nr:TetR/AcrR family transcriptional regulator C-terminal domain-containing protein [Paenibacillus sp. SYP-B4298]